jgi:membrane-bound ClpP family serine protease
MLKFFYYPTVAFGIVIGFLSLFLLKRSPFVPFNWNGLIIFTLATVVFILSFKFKKFLLYVLFALGLLAMLNTYLYFKECSQIKGIELFGGFFISLAPVFSSTSKKEKQKVKG